MSDNPLISVVLPVRYVNYDWLRKSIESVLTQTYKNLELIVVNDESTQPIDDLITEYGIKKYVINERNMKLPYSLNRGFEKAEGMYHTWTSADNYMLPGMLERLAKELDDNSQIGIITGRSYDLKRNGEIVDSLPTEKLISEISKTEYGTRYIPRKLVFYSTLGACFLYRKEVFEKINGYDVSLHGREDYDFWIRASSYFKIARLDYSEPPYYVYRLHDNSISHSTPYCFTKGRYEVLKKESKLDVQNAELREALNFFRLKVRREIKRNNKIFKTMSRLFNLIKKLWMKLPSRN